MIYTGACDLLNLEVPILYSLSAEDLARLEIAEYHKTNLEHAEAQDREDGDTNPMIQCLEEKLECLAESIQNAAARNPEIKNFDNYPFND